MCILLLFHLKSSFGHSKTLLTSFSHMSRKHARMHVYMRVRIHASMYAYVSYNVVLGMKSKLFLSRWHTYNKCTCTHTENVLCTYLEKGTWHTQIPVCFDSRCMHLFCLVCLPNHETVQHSAAYMCIYIWLHALVLPCMSAKSWNSATFSCMYVLYIWLHALVLPCMSVKSWNRCM